MKHLTTYLLRLLASLFLLTIFISCSKEHPVYVIGVSQCSDDEWRAAMNKEIIREALFYPGLKVEIRSAHDDNSLQLLGRFIPSLHKAECPQHDLLYSEDSFFFRQVRNLSRQGHRF